MDNRYAAKRSPRKPRARYAPRAYAATLGKSLSLLNAHTVQSIGHLGDDDLEYSGVMDALELANRVRAQDVLIDTLKSPRSLPVIGWLLRGACWQTLPRIANDPGLRASTRSCSSASSSAMGSGVTAGGATSRVSICRGRWRVSATAERVGARGVWDVVTRAREA